MPQTARSTWDQRRFAGFRTSRNSPAARRAYRSKLELLFGDDLKQAREWDLFARFCEVAHLDVHPAEVEMLDPQGNPPWPDLRAEVIRALSPSRVGRSSSRRLDESTCATTTSASPRPSLTVSVGLEPN